MTTARTPRWPVIGGAIVGLAFAAVGVTSLLQASHDSHPVATATWVAGLAVAHDLLLVPVVLVVGACVARWSRTPIRGWLGAGLLISGTVSLVAWPLVWGYGRSAGNPSILPRNYGAGLVIVLLLVWAAILVLGLLACRRRPIDPNGAPR
jgi:hypothetical protein